MNNTDADCEPSTTMQEPASDDLSVVAARLAEAASRARNGDLEATEAYIAQAVALIRGRTDAGCIDRAASKSATPFARSGLTAWRARKVIAHIESHLSQKVSIRELARHAGLSASHFCRAFKCTFAISPREYVMRCRIELAQALMLTTADSLSAIAIQCGMCDQPHFTRSFHRVVGETPYTWRRNRQRSPVTGKAELPISSRNNGNRLK